MAWMARESIRASVIFSVLEGISYWIHFPLRSAAGLIESGLKNLALFIALGLAFLLVVTLFRRIFRRLFSDPVPFVLSGFLLFPVYFYLLRLFESDLFISRFSEEPKVMALWLIGFLLILFFIVARSLFSRGSRGTTGILVAVYFFITIGTDHVAWGSINGGGAPGYLSLFAVGIASAGLGFVILRLGRISARAGRRILQGLSLRLSIPVAGLLVLISVWMMMRGTGPSGPGSAEVGPHILLVVLDSARQDRFSCYGYGRETTPFLKSFSEGATLYREAISAAPWTMPSHASLFTGLYPTAHGMTWRNLDLGDDLTTLAEFLASKGYRTIGFCNNPWVNRENGLAQGFEEYVEMWREEMLNPTLWDRVEWFFLRFLGRNDGGTFRTIEWVEEWFERVYRPDRPFFLFINLMECHLMYDAPDADHERYLTGDASPVVRRIHSNDLFRILAGEVELTEKEWTDFGDIYDGDLHYLDRKLEELFRFLDRRHFLDQAIVIITSDHGEHLGEHFFIDHQLSVYDPLIRIPLIIKVPEGMAGQIAIDGMVQTVDIYPTLIEMLGYREEAETLGLQGYSLSGQLTSPRTFSISEYDSPKERIDSFLEKNPDRISIRKYDRDLRAIRTDSLKYVWDSNGDGALYDLLQDPGEEIDLVGGGKGAEVSLEKDLSEWLGSFAHAGGGGMKGAEMDRETLHQLRALGYLD